MKNQQSGNIDRSKKASVFWDAMKPSIEDMYFNKLMRQKDIAAVIGLSQAAVCKAMKQWGLTSRVGEKGATNGRYKDGSQSRVYRHAIQKDKCTRCGTVDDLCIHHVNNDHFDNRIENLEVLCNGCHMSHHKKQYWDAVKRGDEIPRSNGPVGWARGEQ